MFTLMKLPYAYDALEPALSAETLEYHHDKHHRGYVDKLNELLDGDLGDSEGNQARALKNLVLNSAGEIYHNAAQIWNHDFYWNSLNPTKKSLSTAGALGGVINTQFGSFQALKDSFVRTAMRLFGSGWLWLTADNTGVIELLPAANADNALRLGVTPLLACDMWEHAYYIDYRNGREAYLHAFWDIVDWPTVAQRFADIGAATPVTKNVAQHRRAHS